MTMRGIGAALADCTFVRRDLAEGVVVLRKPGGEEIKVTSLIYDTHVVGPLITTNAPRPKPPMRVPGLVDPLDAFAHQAGAIIDRAAEEQEDAQGKLEEDHPELAQEIDDANFDDERAVNRSRNTPQLAGYRINGGWAMEEVPRYKRHQAILEAHPEWPEDDLDRTSPHYAEALQRSARERVERNRRAVEGYLEEKADRHEREALLRRSRQEAGARPTLVSLDELSSVFNAEALSAAMKALRANS